jgi:hypothetical protein
MKSYHPTGMVKQTKRYYKKVHIQSASLIPGSLVYKRTRTGIKAWGTSKFTGRRVLHVSYKRNGA